ncbi:N-acetylglucosamine 6-phosphate deacetylase [Sphingomonas gellani]|uniref:N-acetylglucosamine 6-phosphate deacetylase n=1 Tax=Sphingomonas gellani TaxID=1166340 RepID=A0A1H8CZ38_9SPHN|nr:N-acetylglucosamine-6-phosphate deacetylase [Sphingomonas gellani]SEN00159.1 N-acetylglucosamine 6-phosphate deacetylase [Sphingomonas gellani]
MTIHAFANGHIVTPGGVLPAASLDVEGGIIVALDPQIRGDAIDLDGGWIMPGFVDVQVNGGGGVLFNDAPDVDGIAAIGAAHRRYGTTAFLPTLISETPAIIGRALDAVDDAIAAGVPGVVGIHVEGPCINPARKGIHDPRRFRPLDDALLDLLTRPRRGKVMVTLAPEIVPSDRIAALVAAGVIVSLGHSDATLDEAQAGFAAGASGVTHLFNAMSPLLHRAPGLVGAALDNQAVWCGIIADGFHVDPAVLRVALRSRPHDRLMLISDAMPSVGAAEKDFLLGDVPIHVEGGRCLGPDGTLAGCDIDMAAALRGAVSMMQLSPQDASTMASANPAALLGLLAERGALAASLRADWVQLSADLQPVATTVGGDRAEPEPFFAPAPAAHVA